MEKEPFKIERNLREPFIILIGVAYIRSMDPRNSPEQKEQYEKLLYFLVKEYHGAS